MAILLHDLGYALRQLRKSPGFALTVVGTLALSVGTATAVFCVIDNVILRPLPYVHPERILSIESRSRSGYTQPASWPSYVDERAQADTFSALAGYSDYNKVTVETPMGGPMLLDNVRSSDNLFEVFGVKPLLGRTYVRGEEETGKGYVAVLGYDLWQRYFAGNLEVLGRPIKLDGENYTVIGVMPAGFAFPISKRNAVYTPLHLDKSWMQGRGNHWLRTIARLKDGVTLEQAQADLSHVFSNLSTSYITDAGRTVKLSPLANAVSERARGPLWTLLGAVLAVLAIGCVNIAGLLLARGVKREREMAMRTAIGARRMRLVRQVLTEALLLAAMGALGGILLAWAMLDLMRAFLIHALARGAEIHLNWTVLGAAIVAAIAASLAASLYPALRMSSTDPNRALKTGGSAGTQRSQHRLRSGFVVTQVALTLVLLVVSGLLIRMVTQYRHANLGFDSAHILSLELDLSPARYQDRDVIADFYQPLFSHVGHIPEVRAVGVISLLPIKYWGSNSDIHIAGQPPYPANQEMLAEGRIVSTGYFDVFGIPLRRGRMLSPSLDRPENPSSAVVVNERFVRKFVPGKLDPLQQRIDDADKEANWTHIVGVTGNIRQDIYSPPLAERDWLMDAVPLKERAEQLSGMFLVLRTDGDPKTVIPALRRILHEVDPTVPFDEPETMTEVVSETLVFERMETWLFAIFAGLALALAMVGLYGLVSHEVELARRDIGVRMALGATRQRIVRMILTRVAWMVGVGGAVGLALTMLVQKVIGMVIYFEAQREFGGFVLLAILLAAVGIIAAMIPAARAASLEPMQALRSE
jgi:putative ABC transport system permease protein